MYLLHCMCIVLYIPGALNDVLRVACYRLGGDYSRSDPAVVVHNPQPGHLNTCTAQTNRQSFLCSAKKMDIGFYHILLVYTKRK